MSRAELRGYNRRLRRILLGMLRARRPAQKRRQGNLNTIQLIDVGRGATREPDPRPARWARIAAMVAAVLLALCVGPVLSPVAIAAIADADVTGNTGSVHNNISYTITIDMTGANFCILSSSLHTGTGTHAGATITLGGNAMTSRVTGDTTSSDSSQCNLYTWHGTTLTGNQTLSVTGSDSSVRMAGVAASYSGVDQTTVVQGGTSTSGSSTTPARSITTSSGNLAWGGFSQRQGAGTPSVTQSGSQRSIGSVTSTAGSQGVFCHGADCPGGSSAFSWTSTHNQGWSASALEIVAASGGGGTIHSASVAFSGAGSAAYSASRLLAAAVAYNGAGTVAFSATRLLAASASFTGAATFAASPIAIRVASFAAQGVATFAANGEIVPSGPQTHLGSVAFTGAGQFSAAPIVIRAASVAYVGAGTFTGNPVAILQAAAQFTAAGYFAAAGEIFDPANIRATLIRGMRDIRSSSGMGSVHTRAELGAIETTASISEVN